MATSRLPVLLVALAACATTPAVDRASTLVPLEGGAVSLGELAARHEATVLVWWASTCPCVARYEERMQALRARHPDPQVGVYAVVSNVDESVAGVKAETKERGFTLPVLFDPNATLAGELGVRSTPTVVLLDRHGRPLFKGWIDNEREPGESGREPWLDDALEAHLAGRTDFQKRSPTWGCPITRSLFEEVPACCRAGVNTDSGASHDP